MPRRKCALPWFQSDSNEWTNSATRMDLDGDLRGVRPVHLFSLHGSQHLAIGCEVALDHPLRGALDGPRAGSGGQGGAAVGVLDQADEGVLQGLRIIRRHEDRAVA